MKRQNKIIGMVVAGSLLSAGLYTYNQNKYMSTYEKKIASEQMHNFFDSIETVKHKHDKQVEINNKIKEISEFKNSNEYKEREKKVNFLNGLRNKTGIDIDDVKTVDFELTYYTNLPSENGGYTVTCTGEPLSGDIVANNVIPQGTNIILDDRVVKVADRGAESIFSVENRLDVLAHRNSGESDEAYLERVNNMGRVDVKGYILEVNK